MIFDRGSNRENVLLLMAELVEVDFLKEAVHGITDIGEVPEEREVFKGVVHP